MAKRDYNQYMTEEEGIRVKPVSFEHVHITDGFWFERIRVIKDVTSWVCIEECERTHRIDNFRRAGKLQEGGFVGTFFNDSDVYKVLEGVAYVLMNGDSPELEAKADEIIDAICAAQQPDGYLYTYFTLNTSENRWKDMNYHEAYCLGHMIEGAIAYARATGKEKWLKAAQMAVDQMMSVNGSDGQHWVVGHEEIELALVKLYRYTNDLKYIEYAKWLVEERGHGYLKLPLSKHLDFFSPEYCQDDKPVRELSKVTGHAVRAMYYYAGVTDLAAILEENEYEVAMERVWNNLIPANMYITGGIGQSSSNEGFTRNWSLPNLTAYCETCAAIGMAFWNHRMNLVHGNSKYADIVELEMYNGILAGISLSGDKFFYENPLASVGKHHRQRWFGCSCCPTNLIRFIPSIGGYMYATDGDTLYINQFIQSDANIKLASGIINVSMKTDYPWNGLVNINIGSMDGEYDVKIRKPYWCKDSVLTINGVPIDACEDGYYSVSIRKDSEIEYKMEMPICRVHADERILEDAGRVAVMRGPIVYCAEEMDNIGIPSEYFHAEFSLGEYECISKREEKDLLGGVVTLNTDRCKLIPYYAWDNRNYGAMTVWMKEL